MKMAVRKILVVVLSFAILFSILQGAVPLKVYSQEVKIYSANAGVDLESLIGNYIYYGAYAHPLECQVPVWGCGGIQEYEETPTPVIWKVMGHEMVSDNQDDGLLTVMSKYVLDSLSGNNRFTLNTF